MDAALYMYASSLQSQKHTSVCMEGCSEVVCMVADALRSSLQEAKAEAQRVRDCQAELTRQHQVTATPCLIELELRKSFSSVMQKHCSLVQPCVC